MPISVEEVRAQFRSSGKNPASEHQIMTLYNVVGMNGLQGNRHYASYFALQNIDSITSYDAYILLQVLLNKFRYIYLILLTYLNIDLPNIYRIHLLMLTYLIILDNYMDYIYLHKFSYLSDTQE